MSDKRLHPTFLCYGVPQGSILSPLLFFICVNEIKSSLQQGKSVQYADDTTICFSSQSEPPLEQRIFLELNDCIHNFSSLSLESASANLYYNYFICLP